MISNKIKTLFLILMPFLLIGIIWLSYEETSYEFKNVVGVVKNSGMNMDEMGNNYFLEVQLPEFKVLKRIPIRTGVPIKIGKKVLFIKSTNDSSDEAKYTFVKYIE